MASASVLENMKRTVQATVDGFNDDLNYDALRATRSDDFIYQFLPLSLGAPARDNEQYKEFFFAQLKPLFKKFDVQPKTTFYDEPSKRAAFHGKVDVDSVVGENTLELVMMLSFNETGDKVTRIDEFFDSAVYAAFFAKVQELGSQQAS